MKKNRLNYVKRVSKNFKEALSLPTKNKKQEKAKVVDLK